MKQNLQHIDELIAKVLSNEANSEEKAELNGWMIEADDNKVYFESSKKLFETIEAQAPNIDVNVDRAWEKVNARIEGGETKIIPLYKKAILWRVAAAIVFIFTVSVLIYKNYFSIVEPQLAVNAGTKVIQSALPDGSKVTVNKNSSIAYVVKKGKRVVELTGEAYFEVKHNEQQPFEVMVDEVIIQDIGTAFNVRESADKKTIVVSVSEGEIHFYKEGEPGLNLVKGEEAIYDKVNKTFKQVIPEASGNTGSYASKIFEFKETALSEVIRQINEVYGCDIQLKNEKTGDCTVTVLFNQEQLDVILSVLAETLDLKIEKKGAVIFLNGEPCK